MIKPTLFALCLLLSLPASAADGEHGDRRERRFRMMALMGLADALDLNEAEALKLQNAISSFDAQKDSLRKELSAVREQLEKAAGGDASLLPQVDALIHKQGDLRMRLGAVQREMLTAVGKDLTPQKRARLALHFGDLHGMKKFARKHPHRRFDAP
jgi:chromosome segregation ATPase